MKNKFDKTAADRRPDDEDFHMRYNEDEPAEQDSPTEDSYMSDDTGFLEDFGFYADEPELYEEEGYFDDIYSFQEEPEMEQKFPEELKQPEQQEMPENLSEGLFEAEDLQDDEMPYDVGSFENDGFFNFDEDEDDEGFFNFDEPEEEEGQYDLEAESSLFENDGNGEGRFEDDDDEYFGEDEGQFSEDEGYARRQPADPDNYQGTGFSKKKLNDLKKTILDRASQSDKPMPASVKKLVNKINDISKGKIKKKQFLSRDDFSMLPEDYRREFTEFKEKDQSFVDPKTKNRDRSDTKGPGHRQEKDKDNKKKKDEGAGLPAGHRRRTAPSGKGPASHNHRGEKCQYKHPDCPYVEYYAENKSEEKDRASKWNKENKEKYNEYHRHYNAEHGGGKDNRENSEDYREEENHDEHGNWTGEHDERMKTYMKNYRKKVQDGKHKPKKQQFPGVRTKEDQPSRQSSFNDIANNLLFKYLNHE